MDFILNKLYPVRFATSVEINLVNLECILIKRWDFFLINAFVYGVQHRLNVQLGISGTRKYAGPSFSKIGRRNHPYNQKFCVRCWLRPEMYCYPKKKSLKGLNRTNEAGILEHGYVQHNHL